MLLSNKQYMEKLLKEYETTRTQLLEVAKDESTRKVSVAVGHATLWDCL